MGKALLFPWFDRNRALALDLLSFAMVNLLQSRHRLPQDFIRKWELFSEEWQGRDVQDYYQIPADVESQYPRLPDQGRYSFPSLFLSNFTENDRAVFDLYPCSRGWTAPTMIIGHGLMSVSDIGYRMWAKKLNDRGWNAVFCHLPFHYSRRPAGYSSGELCVTGNLLLNAVAIRQAVTECRILLRLLQARGGTLFGGWGTSYGGWILALVACFDPLLQRLILVEPILDVHNAIWKAPSSMAVRRALRGVGLSQEGTTGNMRLVCPTQMQPHLPPERIILIAGDYDRVAPASEIEHLSKLWGGTHYASFRQGHVGYTLMPESFRMAQRVWQDDFNIPLSEPCPISEPA